jgi:16S rRNA (cytidine1402-2'-O)-methyltransferase
MTFDGDKEELKEESPEEWGNLYLVATPIGNLDDITLRALKTFKEVDIIAAEDTRRTRKLLSYYDIHTPLISFREHNKVYQGKKILDRLKSGENVAICSDAGMPLISDPGEDFVRLCINENIKITVIPGPSAALSALVISGLSANTFLYLGFIPRKSKKRDELLEEIAGEPHTLIFYESPFRIVDLLVDLRTYFGERQVCVVREITKFHEEAIRGSLGEVIERMRSKTWKGEFTVVVEGAPQEKVSKEYFEPDKAVEESKKLIEQGYSKKNAAKHLAAKYKTSKRAIYQLIIDAGL